MKGTSICLLGFFLDFLVTISVRSTCFPEDSFLPSREAMDVSVAPYLAKLSRRQFGRNKSFNRLNASLSEAIPKHIHRCGSGEVLGEFLGDIGQE